MTQRFATQDGKVYDICTNRTRLPSAEDVYRSEHPTEIRDYSIVTEGFVTITQADFDLMKRRLGDFAQMREDIRELVGIKQKDNF